MSSSGYLRRKFSSNASKLTSLRQTARERLSLVRAAKDPESFNEPLIEFIPRVSPRWLAPLHLKGYVNILERAPHGNLRIVLAAPPQHAKSETTIHAFAWWLKKFPQLRYAYATYSGPRSQRVGRRALRIAKSADVALDAGNMHLWTTPADGQVLWTSVRGGMTGEPVDGVLVIDDPIKDRKEAESPTIRESLKDWYHGVVEARIHPGASVIVMATRWHADDLSGYLVREQGFDYINFKAIADDANRPEFDERQVGEALWPWKHPLETLIPKREGNPWNFASLYQGEPQPRGSALFKQPTYWDKLPEHGFKVSYGLDLSYTERTHADFSVCVELWVVPPRRISRDQKFEPADWLVYVVDVQRKQVEAPAFTLTLKAKQAHRRAKMFFYASGTEVGAASFIKSKGVPIVVMDTGGRDKFTRAQVTAEMWNRGRILVPSDSEAYPWVDVFVDEVCSFSGVKDPIDDEVDALVSGVDGALKFQDDHGLISSGGRYSS